MVSSVGAAVCPSKGSQLLGSFLLLGGISQLFYLVFTANSAKARANSRLLTGDSGSTPVGREISLWRNANGEQSNSSCFGHFLHLKEKQEKDS